MTFQTQIEDLSKIIELQQVVATSRLPLYELMTLICRETQNLTQAAGAVVELLEDEEMVYKSCSGSLENSLGLRLDMHTSLSGLSVKKNEVLYCKDSEEDDRVNKEACRKVGARSMICVPLIFERPVGVLKVVSPEALKFSERDINLLRLLAGLLSAVIAQADAYKLLSESEAKFKTLIEAAHDGILLSKYGNAFDMNPAFCKLTGFSKEEIFKMPILDLIIPPERKRVSDLLAKGFSDVYQTIMLRKDGTTFTAEIIGKVVVINNDKVRMSTVKDVTKIKEAEEALNESIVKINQTMKSKSEFLANISHEIRTPLNGIAGMAELLRETPLNEDQKKFVKIINDSAENLVQLINGLLDFSKLEAQKMTMEKIEFNLKTLLEDVTNLLIPAASAKSIVLKYALDSKIPEFVFGDVTRLRQVLLNLSNNAIKFTNAGSVTIKVSQNNEQVQFAVIDTGIGIPEKSLAEVFQPFAQVDTSITRRFGGTGLGLAISQQLVEVMKGQLTVESIVGQGSTFKFSLVLPAGNGKTTEVKQNDSLSGADYLMKTKLKILLADDSEDNRLLVIVYLKAFPFEIVTAENGLVALEKMKAERFDLVFMDMQMPEMDGLTSTRLYRAWEKDNLKIRIPIAALSAHALVEEMNKSIEAGCDVHLTKPIKKLSLINSIWDIVKNR